MALFIGSSWKYTAPDPITTGRTYRITARVFPARPGLKLQAVQDDPEVLGDEATVPLAFTWQDVSLDVVAISDDPIVLRCDESLMLVDALEITEAVLPGLEIINFRHLPEGVKESITAASFATPANVAIDAGGIQILGNVDLALSKKYDHVRILAAFSGAMADTDDQFSVGAGASSTGEPYLAALYNSDAIYTSGGGDHVVYTDLATSGDALTVEKAPDSANIHFSVSLGSTHQMRISSLLIMAWDGPVA